MISTFCPRTYRLPIPLFSLRSHSAPLCLVSSTSDTKRCMHCSIQYLVLKRLRQQSDVQCLVEESVRRAGSPASRAGPGCWGRSGVEFEIIVIDDGSPDGTQDVVRRLQDSYGDGRIVRVPPPRASCKRRGVPLCCCRDAAVQAPVLARL